jgi:hypothetical protein
MFVLVREMSRIEGRPARGGDDEVRAVQHLDVTDVWQ